MEFDLVTVHVTILLVTAILIIVADHDGFSYFLGKKQTLDSVRIKRLHYGVLTGLTLMLLTGGALFADQWGELIDNPAFYVKMLMVFALIANSAVIGSIMHIATVKRFSELTSKERHKLLASGGVSAICWIGAASVGFLYL